MMGCLQLPHAEKITPLENNTILLTCKGLASGLGSLFFGKIADLPWINRILLQQVSIASIGLCTMLITIVPHVIGFEFGSLIILALVMGMMDGCFSTLRLPIAYDICGPSGASQAFGFVNGLCSFPTIIAPYIAGLLKDKLGDYTVAFVLAGLPPIISAIFMSFMHHDRLNRTSSSSTEDLDKAASEFDAAEVC